MTQGALLSPAQQAALDGVVAALPAGPIVVLRGRDGRGRTTVLRELHRRLGGVLLTVEHFVEAARRRDPLAMEDALYEVLIEALRQNDSVFLDDLHLATAAVTGCHFYPRAGYLDAPLTVVAAYAAETGKRLVIATEGSPPDPIDQRCYTAAIENFAPEDYRHLCGLFLGEGAAAALDFRKIHRFAPRLNAHQLKGACHWYRGLGRPDTDAFIEYLRSQRLTSNVELGEVADIDLRSLKGIDDVIRSLEANVVLPLEDDRLAEELDLVAKRGVLLAGPPGTGKTTVGRALAHRLKGKFFLIDGTFISGTQDFYTMVHRVFQAAKDNAPSVIFIDDSDVIFESGEEHGLYRYLLTMLDGLESRSAGRVCVMMTAMDVGNLPPALVRSGRIELWLETRLPDADARRAILMEVAARLPAALGGVEVARVAEAAEGFTGADLKRVVEDGKALYAWDRAGGRELRPVTDYFVSAVEAVRSGKEKYAEAEARARQSRPVRPSWFQPYACPTDDDDE